MKNILFSLLLLFTPVLAIASGTNPFFDIPVMSSCDMSTASCNSNGTALDQVHTLAVQAVFTGSPVGTFKLQVSNDTVAICNTTNPSCNVTNWSDVTGSSQAVSAAGNVTWEYALVGFRWIRLVYTKTSGTGTANAKLSAKGL